MITEKLLFHLFEARMRTSLWGQHIPNKGKQPIISTIQQKGTGLALIDFTSPSCCSNDSGRISPEQFPLAKSKGSLCLCCFPEPQHNVVNFDQN